MDIDIDIDMVCVYIYIYINYMHVCTVHIVEYCVDMLCNRIEWDRIG
jgi:hypothetical protein